MLKPVTYITIPNDFNVCYDYQHSRALFDSAIDRMANMDELNQYSPMNLVDALLCVDFSILASNDSEIVSNKAIDILRQNEYHSQEQMIVFMSLVLYQYAIINNVTLHSAWCTFASYGLFDSMYYHYMILHTQSAQYVANSMSKRITVRSDIRVAHGMTKTPSCVTRLSEAMPDIKASDPKASTDFKHLARELANAYGTDIPTDIACLLTVKSTVKGKNIKQAFEDFPIEEVLRDRVVQTKNILHAFTDANKAYRASAHTWLTNASASGLLPLITYAPDATALAKVVEAIREEQEKRAVRDK